MGKSSTPVSWARTTAWAAPVQPRHRTASGPEDVDYPQVEALETSTAAVIVTVGRDIGPPGPRHAIGYRRHVTATLAGPLGARVHINTADQPTSILTGP